jgi:hypothetical protein
MAGMKRALSLVAALAVAGSAAVQALDLDVTVHDIDRGLSIARSTDGERARFHATYIKKLNTPFIESVEVVSEYRRVVLLTEERIRKGERMFAYSTTLAQQALGPWKTRVSIVARVRFHPQNNYVMVPDVDIALPERERARIGVLKDPILAMPNPQPGDRLAVLGAVVEGVFDAAVLRDGTYEFVISVDKKEVGRVTFDLGVLD